MTERTLSGSSTASSTVATVTVAVALPAANVTEVGAGNLTIEPWSLTVSANVSACVAIPIRLT